jgi:hypothetical protein
MNRKSENFITNQNSKNIKSVPEMTWDEILSLPTSNVSNKNIVDFRKKQASEVQKKNK